MTTTTTTSKDQKSINSIEYKLNEDEELRLEVASSGGECTVELIDGLCETFGTELVVHKRYAFTAGQRVAVYTWHGCKLQVSGAIDGTPYIARHTPMIIYLNTHAALESLRSLAASKHMAGGGATAARGPRAMIVGPTDVGKSTYCRILLNYAARQGRTPIYVDLDVGQGSVSVRCVCMPWMANKLCAQLPGTVSALFIERPADVVDGFDARHPLVYNVGMLSPGKNTLLYNTIVESLARTINDKCERNADAAAAGMIINTCGWIKGDGYACLVAAAEAFEVDVVVVLDHERLYNELQRDLPSFVRIVHQPKSGGVEDRTREQRIKARRTRIRQVSRQLVWCMSVRSQYFYGTTSQPYFPHSFYVGFDDVLIVKMGADELPASCMPLGMKTTEHRTQIVRVQPDAALRHHLLAVTLADQPDEQVNMETRQLGLLSPQPHPLPARLLVYSEVDYVDDK